jgi:AcrB/AcrD/AcrF family
MLQRRTARARDTRPPQQHEMTRPEIFSVRTANLHKIVARTSDQAKQVAEKIGLFTMNLYEAVIVVIVVALVGFRLWRSALVLTISIPVTLAMTFSFMAFLGIDIQQLSIVALILALGLLVDEPVVAFDAIQSELDRGRSRVVSAWLGPTRLARPIFYATITWLSPPPSRCAWEDRLSESGPRDLSTRRHLVHRAPVRRLVVLASHLGRRGLMRHTAA